MDEQEARLVVMAAEYIAAYFRHDEATMDAIVPRTSVNGAFEALAKGCELLVTELL